MVAGTKQDVFKETMKASVVCFYKHVNGKTRYVSMEKALWMNQSVWLWSAGGVGWFHVAVIEVGGKIRHQTSGLRSSGVFHGETADRTWPKRNITTDSQNLWTHLASIHFLKAIRAYWRDLFQILQLINMMHFWNTIFRKILVLSSPLSDLLWWRNT